MEENAEMFQTDFNGIVCSIGSARRKYKPTSIVKVT